MDPDHRLAKVCPKETLLEKGVWLWQTTNCILCTFGYSLLYMFQCVSGSTAITNTDQKGFIVVETNYRLYAYTGMQ